MGATAMLDFRLSKVSCKREGRSDGNEAGMVGVYKKDKWVMIKQRKNGMMKA